MCVGVCRHTVTVLGLYSPMQETFLGSYPTERPMVLSAEVPAESTRWRRMYEKHLTGRLENYTALESPQKNCNS